MEKREEDLRRNIAVKWVWAAWHHAVIKPVFWNSVSNSCAQVRWRSFSSTCRLVCEWNIFTGRSSNSGEREREREGGLRHYAILPSERKKGGFKEVSYKTSNSSAECLCASQPGLCVLLCRVHLSSTMLLTHDAWDNKAVRDLFLLLVDVRYSLCFHRLARVSGEFQAGAAAFVHFSWGWPTRIYCSLPLQLPCDLTALRYDDSLAGGERALGWKLWRVCLCCSAAGPWFTCIPAPRRVSAQVRR